MPDAVFYGWSVAPLVVAAVLFTVLFGLELWRTWRVQRDAREELRAAAPAPLASRFEVDVDDDWRGFPV